ncbi:MAG: hypothetical protein ACOC0O_01745 [Spirochaetota bacterium]
MTAVAGVRGTDFGYDQVLDPITGELINRVYCLEGEISVTLTADSIEERTIRTGETVTAPVAARSEETRPVSVVALEEPVRAFWTARPFVREVRDAGALIHEFPSLPERAREAVGVVPPVIEQAVAQAARPVVTESEAEKPALAVEEVVEEEREPAGLAEAVLGERDTPELRGQIAGTLRTTGYWLTGVGVAVDLAVVGLVLFGDQVPGWNAAWDPYLAPVGAAGVGVVVLGAASIVLSLAFSN